jgi:hypothetical protein
MEAWRGDVDPTMRYLRMAEENSKGWEPQGHGCPQTHTRRPHSCVLARHAIATWVGCNMILLCSCERSRAHCH